MLRPPVAALACVRPACPMADDTAGSADVGHTGLLMWERAVARARSQRMARHQGGNLGSSLTAKGGLGGLEGDREVVMETEVSA